MKRLAISMAAAALLISSVSAYNPPAFGDSIFELSNPKALSGAYSVAGNDTVGLGPDSIIVNPALPAESQRVMLNAAYTALVSAESLNKDYSDYGTYGNAFQTAVLVPFKWFNFSGYVNGTMAPMMEMYLKNSVTFKAGLSKQITPKLNIGVNGDAGFAWGKGSDWAAGAGLGFTYDIGELGFIPDLRIGAAVLNLGKYYDLDFTGVESAKSSSWYPSFSTLKGGIGVTFFKNDTLKIDGSADVTVPFVQNVILDFGAQVAIKNQFIFSVAEKVNFKELADYKDYSGKSRNHLIPALGFFYKFSFDVRNNSFFEKHDWGTNDLQISGAYRNLYNTVNAISVGADLTLGQEDTSAPDIELWSDEE